MRIVLSHVREKRQLLKLEAFGKIFPNTRTPRMRAMQRRSSAVCRWIGIFSDDKEASDAECLTLNFSSLLDKARVLFQSLADEATKSSPSVGGTTGIRGSLSRHTHACQVLSKSLLLALLHFLLPLHSTGS